MLGRLLALLLLILTALCGPLAAQEPRIGPGDVLFLALPGEDSLNREFKVDRDGRVILPEVGALEIAGATVDEARETVRDALARVYRDLGRFDLLLKERRLLVSVSGYVREPGPVDLPAEANLQAAIAAAGGIVPGAQLDRVQLRRDGETIPVDYKRWLDSGQAELLPALRSLDEIFVPASPLTGNVQVDFDAQTLNAAGDAADRDTAIRVFGEVSRPGAYAFKDGSSIVDYLLRAGGATRFGAVDQVRVLTRGEPVVFDLQAYLDDPRGTAPLAVEPGATIYVPIATEAIRAGNRTVYVMGEVFKPGAFETREGVAFLDILANAGGPTRFAETRQIRILRGDGSVEPFDLQAYTEGRTRELPEIRVGDAILVPEKTDLNEKSWLKVPPSRAVMVMGAVASPGRYEWSDEMSLLDLLGHAGGPTARADVAAVQVVPSTGAQPRQFDLGSFLERGGTLAQIPDVRAGDTIMVPELPEDPADSKSQWIRQGADRSIYILGAVGAPGRYAFDPELSFIDILSAADGPTASADIRKLRVSHGGGPNPRVSRVDLALFFETGDAAVLPRVRPGDVIYVPSREGDWRDAAPSSTVRVLGAVGRPGRYAFDEQMSILDVLAEAGGPTADAYVENIVVVNLSCCPNEARSFDLLAFAKTGDVRAIPVLRAGDTVYVPTKAQSNWRIFMDGVRDAVSILSIVVLAAAL